MPAHTPPGQTSAPGGRGILTLILLLFLVPSTQQMLRFVQSVTRNQTPTRQPGDTCCPANCYLEQGREERIIFLATRPTGQALTEAKSSHKDSSVIRKIPLLFLKCCHTQCKNHDSGFHNFTDYRKLTFHHLYRNLPPTSDAAPRWLKQGRKEGQRISKDNCSSRGQPEASSALLKPRLSPKDLQPL